MRKCGVPLITVLALLINLFGMGLAPLSAAAAPASSHYEVEAVVSRSNPSFAPAYEPVRNEVKKSGDPMSLDVLPSWFSSVSDGDVEAIYADESEETYTDSLGQYRFEDLPYGTHRVTIDAATLPAALRPDAEESVPVLWLVPGQTLTSEGLFTGVRFTAVYDRESGAISGLVFLDQDGDAQPSPTDAGIPGVRVVDPTVHQYFVPFDDQDLWVLFQEKASCHGVDNLACGPMLSFLHLTASSDGTVYYYDHWEDGYDPDPLDPGPTTEVGIVDAAVPLLFQSTITPSLVGTQFFYDGRDRITIFGDPASVVRMVRPSSFSINGTCPGDPDTSGWLASAWEVPETADWGAEYVATVGEDLSFTIDHAYAGLEVMASQDGTDVYYNGSLVDTLNAGQVYFVDGENDGAGGAGGIDSDDTITATAPVQVQMMTGACSAEIVSAHGYTLQPLEAWDDAYWAPTPGFVQSCNPDGRNVDTDIYVHNPHDQPITVTVAGSVTVEVVIPANTSDSILNLTGWADLSEGNQGTRLFSSEPFWGVVAVDSSTNGATGADDWDWGYSLIPESKLSSQVVIGYAPGNENPARFDNGNLAFVTAIVDTVIYVDLNQDGLPDPFDMDGDGEYDDEDVWGIAEWDEPLSALGIPLQAGQVLRVSDPYDEDLVGALIYTTDLEDRIAVAWGQDPCRADYLAYVDLGYTALPVQIPLISKTDDLAVDADLSGGVSPGDTITYNLVLRNNGRGNMNDAVLTDTLPYTYTDFVVGSLQVTTPPPTESIAYYDGASWGSSPIPQAQMFRITWETIGPGRAVTITFRVRLQDSIPPTVTQITNSATLNSDETNPAGSQDPEDPGDPDTDTSIERPYLSMDKRVSATTVQPGGRITYTVVVSNYGAGVALFTAITDVLPSGLTYIPGTLDLTWPIVQIEVVTRTVTHTSFFHGHYADDFDLTVTQTSSYNGNDGSLAWLTDWDEINDDDNPTGGDVQVEEVALNALSDPAYLRMAGNGGAGLGRTADLAEFQAPWLRYHMFGETDAPDDEYSVEVGTVFTSEQYSGSYTLRELDLTAMAGTAAATLYFTATSSMEPSDYYRFDDIAIYETDPERVDTKTLTWEYASLSYISSTGGDPLSYDPLTGRMVVTQGIRLPPGGFITVTFQAQVATPLTDSLMLTNTACVTSANWTDITSPPCDDASVLVNSSHTLTVAKTADPTPAVAGGLLTYTIYYTITGDEAVSSIVISDTTPEYTTFYTATPTPDSDPGVGGVGPVIWQISGLWPPGSGITQSTGTVNMVVLVSSALVSGTTVANSVIVTDTTGTAATDTVAIPAIVAADVSVAKRDNPDPVVPGGPLVYTLVYTNSGPSDAENVVVTDTLPAEVAFVGANPAQDAGPNPLVWNLGTVAAGSGGTIQVTVTVQLWVTGTFTNSVRIGTSTPETDYTNNEDEEPASVPTDVTIVKSDDVDPVVPGSPLVYTLVYTNYGPFDAENVVISDTLPAEVAFVGADPAQDAGPNPLVWNLGTVAAGNGGTIRITVTVQSWVTQTFTNVVSIATSTSETDYTNNDDGEPTDVNPLADVTIAKSDDVDPVVPGNPLVYTLVYTNNGPSDAENVVVTDTLPAEVTFVGADPTQVSGPNPLVWNLGTVAAGDSGTIRITVTVQSWVTQTFTNVVSIATSTSETDYTNNDDEEPTDVNPLADVTITKSDDVDPVVPGNPLVYTLVYTNNGPSDAENVVVTDTLPAEVAFVGADPTQDAGPNPLVWNLGTVAAGDSDAIRITVTVQSWVTQTFTNVVSIATSTPETDYTNNDDEEPTDVVQPTDVTITKSDDVDPVVPGEPLVYTLVYTNNGPSDAENVVVTDTLPAEVAFVNADPVQDAGPNPLVWNLGTVAVGSGGTIRITVTVQSWVTQTFTNVVSIATSTPETDYTNNDDEEPTDVNPLADVTITKSDDVDPVVPGNPLVYTLVYTNNGPSDAENVVVTDTLPAEVAFVGANPAQDAGPNPLVWNLGTIAAGNGGTIRITVTVQSWVTQTFTNVVSIATSTSETDYTNNDDEEPTDVNPLTDVTITKSDDVDPVVPGNPLVYTLVYTNNGPSDAENVVVTDTLPAEVAFVDADPAQDAGPNPLVWNLGTIAAGNGGTIRITVTVQSWVTQTFTNVVSIATSTSETDYTNNDDEEPTSPPMPGITVVKVVEPTQAVPRMPIRYTIRITNTGDIAFTTVVLTDTLPPDFYYVAGSGQPTEPDVIAEPILVWRNLGPLAPANSLTVTYAVTTTSSITGDRVNMVTAAGTIPGGVITDTSDATVTIEEPRVVMNKRVAAIDTDDLAPNYVTFTIAITNVGPSAIDVLPLTDRYDNYYLAFEDATPYPEDDTNDGTLAWNDLTGPAPNGFGRNLLPGEVFLVTTIFRVVHDIVVTTTNTAIITDITDVYGNPTNGIVDEVGIGGGQGIPTPIEVLYLRAVAEETAIRIEWATAAELGTMGFHIYRSPSASFRDAQAIAYVLATGPGSTYDYVDRDVTPDQPYWYWLVEEVSFGDPDIYGPTRGAAEIDALRYRLYLPLIRQQRQDQYGMPLDRIPSQVQPRWAEWAFSGEPGPGTRFLARLQRR